MFDSNVCCSHWLSRGHLDEFKTNVPQLANISKAVDQPRERVGNFDNCGLFCLCYNNTLNDCSLRKHLFCFI